MTVLMLLNVYLDGVVSSIISNSCKLLFGIGESQLLCSGVQAVFLTKEVWSAANSKAELCSRPQAYNQCMVLRCNVRL